ncbi:hypothetical protein [Sphingomonas suaedae]|uniref:hypothetical protein n=1 Tax=Sphingomonas suaedae TaxID=2599297 RepID=UPI0016493943|nr:hypothetical protein [Sphingomonas suaedae]
MRAYLMLPLLALAACNATDDTTGVTAGEAAELNQAADTLDINATDPDPQDADSTPE